MASYTRILSFDDCLIEIKYMAGDRGRLGNREQGNREEKAQCVREQGTWEQGICERLKTNKDNKYLYTNRRNIVE